MIIAIIQARIASARLPGKVMFDLEGETVLEQVIKRVKSSKMIDDIIIATTIKKADLKIVKICNNIGIKYFCGSEEDVLDRYYQAAKLFNPKQVARITSDCPLIDPKVIDKVIRLHLKEKADYTSNTLKEIFPDGEDVEIFTFETLNKAWRNAKLLSEREHVTPYIKKHPKIFKIRNLENDKNLSNKRWTLDNPEDYEFIKVIYKNLYVKNHLFGVEEILDFLNRNPDVERINEHIKRNEGYLKSLKNDKVQKIYGDK
ncbi:MAG: acylneuraminate cytidylyltransferase [Actinobacteria bacterium]|nr:acylneuraminate cytidylyltransferase [Actinomycetota bacterium]